MARRPSLPPYRDSLAGSLLGAREAVMAPIRLVLREAELSEQQWRVIRVLCDESAIDAKTLAASAMLHAPSVTRILKELEQRRLIARATDPKDARRQIIIATDEGRRIVREVAQVTLGVLADYAASFGHQRLRHLIDELQAFRAAIDGYRIDE